MKTEIPFSFEEKKVTVVGGKGKMGASFGEGLRSAGANIQIVDLDTQPLGENLETDAILFAVNERIILDFLQKISDEVIHNIPIITTSSTNSLLWQHWYKNQEKFGHLVPLHALCGPNMKGSVMIDCTSPQTLGRSIAFEIARIMKMEVEHLSFEDHDREIALGQAQFHREVWIFVRKTPNLVQYISRLPISQRRAAIGNFRVLLRPDISAEFLAAFGGDDRAENCFSANGGENEVWSPLSNFRHALDVPDYTEDAESERQARLVKKLQSIINDKDPGGLIRDWIRRENEKMDQGVVGGPRSFQEFLRNR